MKLSSSYKNGPLPAPRTALALYKKMVLVRRTEERIVQLYPEQQMRCPVHLSIGQEAAAAGTCQAFGAGDAVFSSHRCHAHYLAMGGDLDAMIAELYGKASGCCRGKGGSMHLIDVQAGCAASSAIVGGCIPIAVGAAMGFSRLGKKGIAAAFLGDGAADEGVFYESMNFAALHELPVLFAVENNFYATQSPQHRRQATDNIYKRGTAFGVPGKRLDGNNVFEVYNAARDAVQFMRGGGGPVLFELRTYRWYGHVGTSDDAHLNYRLDSERSKWRNKCPLKRFKAQALKASLITEKQMAAADDDIRRRVEAAFDKAKKAPFPKPADLYTDLFQD